MKDNLNGARLMAQDVHFAYDADQPVLHGISVGVRPGEVLYILGRNGTGKTTLMSCLTGVLKPTAGQVLLDGRELASYDAAGRARRVGLIPQLHVAAFAYSVRDMVLMGRAPHLSLFGTPRRADHAIVDQALHSVGLTDYAERPYTQLSGGERQLVMIARGLAQQCEVLLMDEPDAHLDPNNQHRVMEIVTQLARTGLSFVVSSHAPNNALLYADRVLLMQAGTALALGSVEETLTAALLTRAYDMPTEVIYQDGRPRAIVPLPRAACPRTS